MRTRTSKFAARYSRIATKHVPQPPDYMISKMIHFGNILSPIFTITKEDYEAHIESLNRFQVECNDCHQCGCCIKHGYYIRNYITSPTNYEKIQILRMLCKACGSTHAILPEEIVPYASYSVIFMFLVLYLYYVERRPVSAICEHLKIVPAVLYRWKRTYMKHKDSYLGILKSDKHTESDVLSWLKNLHSYGQEFAAGFMMKTERMPMQTHRNPTNTHRPVLA